MGKKDRNRAILIEPSKISSKDEYHRYVRLMLERNKSTGNGNDLTSEKNALMKKNIDFDITDEV